MHWVCVPTAEEDFNWIPFFLIGHEKEEYVNRGSVAGVNGVTFRDEAGVAPDEHFPDANSILDAFSQKWRAEWEARTGNDWLEDEADYEDFATFMRGRGYEVHIGRMEWAQGVIS